MKAGALDYIVILFSFIKSETRENLRELFLAYSNIS